MLKIKIFVCFSWIILVATLFLIQAFLTVSSQPKETAVVKNTNSNRKPENVLIARFDNAIQRRFLTEPNFGMKRIQPAHPTNPLEQFSPINGEEEASVAAFEKESWKVSLYLFGRRANPKIVNGKEQFSINYRLNKALPITDGLKKEQLPAAGKLLTQIKSAFLEFQTSSSPNENSYEFEIGKWSYVAKPVRAINQSCLKCHNDYVITEKIGDNQYKFRKRQVGDANGVIVYGFAKTD